MSLEINVEQKNVGGRKGREEGEGRRSGKEGACYWPAQSVSVRVFTATSLSADLVAALWDVVGRRWGRYSTDMSVNHFRHQLTYSLEFAALQLGSVNPPSGLFQWNLRRWHGTVHCESVTTVPVSQAATGCLFTCLTWDSELLNNKYCVPLFHILRPSRKQEKILSKYLLNK